MSIAIFMIGALLKTPTSNPTETAIVKNNKSPKICLFNFGLQYKRNTTDENIHKTYKIILNVIGPNSRILPLPKRKSSRSTIFKRNEWILLNRIRTFACPKDFLNNSEKPQIHIF